MLGLNNLDAETRAMMRSEVESDIANAVLYESSRLSARGRDGYPTLLLEAVDRGDDRSLGNDLRMHRRMNAKETATRGGKTFTKDVPVTAPQTLAEGEFNRFYARGLCRRAIAEGVTHVRVYRAKNVASPRSTSEVMIGNLIDAKALLEDLRTSRGIEPALACHPDRTRASASSCHSESC